MNSNWAMYVSWPWFFQNARRVDFESFSQISWGVSATDPRHPRAPLGPLGLWQWNIPPLGGLFPHLVDEVFELQSLNEIRIPRGGILNGSRTGQKRTVPVAGHRTKKWPKHQMCVIIISIYYYKWLYNLYNQFISSSNCESDSFCGTGWVCSMPHLPCACSYCTTWPTRPMATETETQLASWSDWPSVEALDASNIISKRCHHVKVGCSSLIFFKLLITHLIHQPVFLNDRINMEMRHFSIQNLCFSLFLHIWGGVFACKSQRFWCEHVWGFHGFSEQTKIACFPKSNPLSQYDGDLMVNNGDLMVI